MRNIMNERLSVSKSLPLKARFYDYKHFTYPWHFHPEYEIIYIKEGAGVRFIGSSVGKYSGGDVFLIGSNLPHYLKSDDIYYSEACERRVTGTIIQFEQEFMRHAITYYPHFVKIKNLLHDAHQGIHFPAGCSAELTALLEAIPQETGMNQLISFLMLLKKMSEIRAGKLISNSEISAISSPAGVSKIEKIVSFINKHYTRQISLPEISSVAAMNPAAFCRFFKNKTGKTFKNYLLDMRIGYACKLLLMNDMHISQICFACGFDSVSHFNKNFKKIMTFTPSHYREIMLQDFSSDKNV